MAVAGLHNVSALDSSFLRESASQSSRWREDEAMPGTPASSILRMWRELEDEHGVSGAGGRTRSLRQRESDGADDDIRSTNTCESQGNEQRGGSDDMSEDDSECATWSQSQIATQNGNENCIGSEQSPCFGTVERERVRHIFREWMNNGESGHSSGASHMNNSSSAQWLGEKECERVRIIREWVQMNSQQRSSCGDGRESQSAEIGGQLDKVRDGLVVNHTEGVTGHVHRHICRLRGRQALLDMLVRAERERQRELQNLLEHRAVSNFSHRNRIQSLLRGRFLRNERVPEDQRPASMAAGELGLLKRRQTVSGIREGFLSRLDNSVPGQVGINHSDTSSGGVDADGNETAIPVQPPESTNEESDTSALSDHTDNIDGNNIETISRQSSAANDHAENRSEQDLENEKRNGQQVTNVQLLARSPSSSEDVDCNLNESSTNERVREYEGREHSVVRFDSSNEERDTHRVSYSDHLHDPEVNSVGVMDWQGLAEEDLHEQLTDGEGDWEQLSGVVIGSWRNSIEEMDGGLHIGTSDHSSQYITGNDVAEASLPESHEVWHEDGSEGATESRSEGPAEWAPLPGASANAFLSPDDDNVNNLELRELLSRRSVSNLLQSGFRENLDRLVQSYVERQAHATVDWDLDGMSSSQSSEVHDQEQPSGNQNEGLIDSVESQLSRPPQAVSPQPLWAQDNWSRQSIHQSLGFEWDIVNDLRIDITTLQHRMDNMQRMLEACMDMQLELQRSIRQEVSAALNRARSPESGDADFPDDGSKWDHVRKGICCICGDSNIDSLLYRCGHMCTCDNCASKLVQGSGKCPMCHAPVIEVIRAYLTV